MHHTYPLGFAIFAWFFPPIFSRSRMVRKRRLLDQTTNVRARDSSDFLGLCGSSPAARNPIHRSTRAVSRRCLSGMLVPVAPPAPGASRCSIACEVRRPREPDGSSFCSGSGTPGRTTRSGFRCGQRVRDDGERLRACRERLRPFRGTRRLGGFSAEARSGALTKLPRRLGSRASAGADEQSIYAATLADVVAHADRVAKKHQSLVVVTP